MKSEKSEPNKLVKYGEFRGQPMIYLLKYADDKYPFGFGIIKAKLIVENYDAIKAFADKV